MDALVARHPSLAATIPRADLGVRESPLERWVVGGAGLLIKRDDLSAELFGGNKVRALELLLAPVKRGDTVLTAGATGSTHALSVALHASRLGACAEVITWPQENHAVSRAVADRLRRSAHVTAARNVAEAYLRIAARRARGGRRWIPAGGSTPLGVIAHASAVLELADQLELQDMPAPHVIVVPLGTGGTAAGLLLGVALAGLPTHVVGVQVVPRVVASARRVASLARRARAILAGAIGDGLPRPDTTRFSVERDAYGGAYGRETQAAREAAERLLDAGGPRLESTYSGKAFGVALDLARRAPHRRTLFWLTFDARWLAGVPF